MDSVTAGVPLLPSPSDVCYLECTRIQSVSVLLNPRIRCTLGLLGAL